MKVFITGASGFIGSHLSLRLAEEHNDVTLLLRNPSVSREFQERGIKIIKGDIFNKEILKAGMSECDWVFHLAAYTRPVSKDPDLPYRTNVQGTLNVLESAKDQMVRRVIITSSAGTLNFSVNGLPVNEDTETTNSYNTEYERTKAAAEKAALEHCSDNPDIIIVNPTRVYGPGKLTLSNSVTRIIKLYGKGLWRFIPGDGESIGNYVFISDVINGIIQAAVSGKGGERYILGGENISYREFFRQLGEVYGKERKLININEKWLKRIAGAAAIYSKMTGKPAAITGEWIEKYLKNWIVSSHKAELFLNYKITPFREGAAMTVSWLNSNNI
jgi:nucleoside-diphosphate-sugar epimerase